MYFSTKHKERMAIIDKGGEIKFPQQRVNKNAALKWGLILVFLGIALGIGIALDIENNNDGPFFTIPLILVGGGLGQLLYHRLNKDSE